MPYQSVVGHSPPGHGFESAGFYSVMLLPCHWRLLGKFRLIQKWPQSESIYNFVSQYVLLLDWVNVSRQ